MHVGVVNGAEYAVFGRSGHSWDGDVSLLVVCQNQCGGVFLDASFQKCLRKLCRFLLVFIG